MEICELKEDIMLFYSHYFREQHDWQNPSLATRACQTLDKTGYINLDHRHPFRSNTQPYRSGCRKCVVAPAIDRVESTDQATSANQHRSYSPGVSIPLYKVLETSPSYRSARYLVVLAPGIVWHVLAAEIARETKDLT